MTRRERVGSIICSTFSRLDPDPNGAPNLYRLFEYLTVRPRFAGTETLLNPSTTSPHFGSNGRRHRDAAPAIQRDLDLPRTGTDQPEHDLPDDHQAVVLCRAFGTESWGAHQRLSFAEFIDSRRGYGTAGQRHLSLDSSRADVFANPYRPPGTSLLIPPDADGDADLKELARLEVDGTLLRTNRTDDGADTAPAAADVPRI